MQDLSRCPRNLLVCERSSFQNQKNRVSAQVEQMHFNYKVSRSTTKADYKPGLKKFWAPKSKRFTFARALRIRIMHLLCPWRQHREIHSCSRRKHVMVYCCAPEGSTFWWSYMLLNAEWSQIFLSFLSRIYSAMFRNGDCWLAVPSSF